MAARKALALVLGALAPACGLIIGIESLELDEAATQGEDAWVSPTVDAEPADAPPSDLPDVYLPPQRLPPEGTFTYAVSGHDRITGIITPPQSNYGPTATVTIAHHDGGRCFDMKIHLRNNYDETLTMCLHQESELPRESIVQVSGTRQQKFAVGSASTVLDCKDAGDVYFNQDVPVGKTWHHECAGRNSDDQTGGDSEFVTAGLYTFQGLETVDLGDAGEVPVRHFYDVRSVSGAQSGSNVADWYLSPEEGVIVRLERKIAIRFGSLANYSETVTMTLSELPDGGLR